MYIQTNNPNKLNKLSANIVLLLCLFFSMPQVRTVSEPLIKNQWERIQNLDLNYLNGCTCFSFFTVSKHHEIRLLLGAQTSYQASLDLPSPASDALFFTVDSKNDWTDYSSAKSNQHFTGKFSGPFSFYPIEKHYDTPGDIKNKFSQGDLSHSAISRASSQQSVMVLETSNFCCNQIAASIFGRGACSIADRKNIRNLDSCSSRIGC